MDGTTAFEAERPRLLRLATRVLGDHAEAEDVVQQAWLRLHAASAAGAVVADLPAWLTTVTTRLCLDRLRSRTPILTDDVEAAEAAGAASDRAADPASDPAHDVALADSVGIALHLVLDRLSPRERVAFVLHDSFGFEFPTIAAVLETTPVAARKLASRARAKVQQPAPEDRLAEAEVVDAFMAAARGGDLDRLVRLLAPDAEVRADDAAVAAGTPERIQGRRRVAEFFNGSARAALPAFFGDRPAAAWYHRGRARVLFDVTVAGGVVQRITFRAEPEALAQVRRRETAGRDES